jgi:probable F420-dependent oxidoreductase
MELGEVGVLSGWDVLAPKPLIDAAREIESLGYGTLWAGENIGREPFAQLAFVAAATDRLAVATAIAVISSRAPGTARRVAATLSELSGGRFALGLGVGHPGYVERWWGTAYDRPVDRMRSYLDAYRDAEVELEAPPPPVLLAALRPRMLRLAAERADGAILHLYTPEQVAAARAVLGPNALVACSLPVSLARDGRERARTYLEAYDGVPNYAELVATGPERLVALGIDGARERIAELREAGADHVALFPLDGDPWYEPHLGVLRTLRAA